MWIKIISFVTFASLIMLHYHVMLSLIIVNIRFTRDRRNLLLRVQSARDNRDVCT